jgi:hypothetical protein
VDTHLHRQVQHSGGSGKLGPFFRPGRAGQAARCIVMTTSLPRPVLLAVVGVAAIAALLFTMRRGSEQAATSPPAATGPGAAQPGAQGSTPAQPGTATTPGEAPAPAGSPSGQGSGAGTTSPDKQVRVNEPRTLPPAVKRALDAHKVVVLLFWNPRGTDDRSVKQAVDSVGRRGGKVAVFTNDLSRLARYVRVTSPTNVTQSPTVVVVDPKGNARTASGYLDAASVDQYVVDALRRG